MHVLVAAFMFTFVARFLRAFIWPISQLTCQVSVEFQFNPTMLCLIYTECRDQAALPIASAIMKKKGDNNVGQEDAVFKIVQVSMVLYQAHEGIWLIFSSTYTQSLS